MAQQKNFRVDPDKDLVDLEGASILSGYSRSQLRNYIDSGLVKAWKFGVRGIYLLYKPHVISLRDKTSNVGRPREREPQDLD